MVDVATLKMARKPVKMQRKVQQDALGKVNNLTNGKEASEDTEESPAGCTGEGKQP